MKSWKIIGALLASWLVILIYMSNSFSSDNNNANDLERQLKRALRELEQLKTQNNQLKSVAEDLRKVKLKSGGSSQLKEIEDRFNKIDNENSKAEVKDTCRAGVYSLAHELQQRKVDRDITEFWFYMNTKLERLKTNGNHEVAGDILKRAQDYQRTLRNDMQSLYDTDEMDKWREKEGKELGELVQKRLHYIQNPKDCSKAKKIVCNLSKGCGYGCQLHHVAYCLITAYALERTLVLESKGWRYAAAGWESVFLPLSNNCIDRQGQGARHWSDPRNLVNEMAIEMPIIDSLHPRPDFLPLAVPEDLAPRLTKLHGNPSVWWIGQIVKYLTRPQPHLQKDIASVNQRLKFSGPIVGVHVRRTDKVGTEAAFHGIDEYMKHVEEYFDLLETRQTVEKRKIFLASDDPSVATEARQKYPHYEIINDPDITQSAGLNKRYTDESLRGIILDIHFLSLCDYLVCTFSSQVCRVAYEMMQTMYGDASPKFKSLDDIFYFGGQNAHNEEVVERHVAQSNMEIDLEPGDLIGIAGNHWDGFSKGLNRRTGKTGLYPSYKTKDHVTTSKMPLYHQVR
ncbi:alpha-(1,6)-fucosyltransferase-like [Mytilus californianus]|uniref:alpha-(1,6)-fucosyltransferase-like n=1 Tax=Mytilus californianus TaxID=6549 RepID=UPI0022467F30|nr:alpha-(1,6)-fucosyltransferase-like [Mytilus californianus]